MKTLHTRILIPIMVVSLILTSRITPLQASLAQTSPDSILVVVNNSYSVNPFGRYLGEILRAEGLDAYTMLDLSEVTLPELQQHDVVLLAETSLSSVQANMFTDYVNGGGRLVSMNPDAQIAGLFGLDASAGTMGSGYMKINDTTAWNGNNVGSELSNVPLQVHVSINKYNLAAGATAIASIYNDAQTSTSYPAVVGSSSGHTAAFTYDLAKNIVYTRQGNPANANVDIDGDGVFRTIDLFQSTGGSLWVDRDFNSGSPGRRATKIVNPYHTATC